MARAALERRWANLLVGLMLAALGFVYFAAYQMLGGPDWARHAARGWIDLVGTVDVAGGGGEVPHQGAPPTAASAGAADPFDFDTIDFSNRPGPPTWLGLRDDDLERWLGLWPMWGLMSFLGWCCLDSERHKAVWVLAVVLPLGVLTTPSASGPPHEKLVSLSWHALGVVTGLAIGAVVAARALAALRRVPAR